MHSNLEDNVDYVFMYKPILTPTYYEIIVCKTNFVFILEIKMMFTSKLYKDIHSISKRKYINNVIGSA